MSAGSCFFEEQAAPLGMPTVFTNPLYGGPAPERSFWSLGDQIRGCCPLCTLPVSQCTPCATCGRVGTGFALNWRSVRRPPTPCSLALLPRAHRRTQPHVDGHQRAAVTTCCTGGLSPVPNMTDTRICRVTPSPGQYLARSIF